MFCEVHLKKKSSFIPPPPCVRMWGCATVRVGFYHRNAIKPISNRCGFVKHIPRYATSWAKAVRFMCILVKRESFSIHRLLLFLKKIENYWDELTGGGRDVIPLSCWIVAGVLELCSFCWGRVTSKPWGFSDGLMCDRLTSEGMIREKKTSDRSFSSKNYTIIQYNSEHTVSLKLYQINNITKNIIIH